MKTYCLRMIIKNGNGAMVLRRWLFKNNVNRKGTAFNTVPFLF